jgi:hypothetical protein
MNRRLLILLATVALLMTLAVPAGAENDRVTYGDVRGHFQTAEGGGAVSFQTGTPAAFSAGGNIFDHSIRPFPGSPWDGRHVCEDDWHLLAIALIDGSTDRSYTRAEFVAGGEGATVDLILDGNVLSDTESTVPKRFKSTFNNDILEGYWVQIGAFLGPDDLAVGSHTFAASADIPSVPVSWVAGPITFYVDASGSGVCVD